MTSQKIVGLSHIKKLFHPERSLKDILRLRFAPKQLVTALDDISLEVRQGTILGLLGPNGAGKTTLLRIISTLLIADHGSISLFGEKIDGRVRHDIISKIGLLSSEERNFYWRLTVYQNLEFFAAMYNIGKAQAKSRINELGDYFRLKDMNKMFSACSAGTKRKCAIIKALIHDPQLILLDEPGKSLDHKTSEKLKTYILSKKDEKTFIIATHDLSEAKGLCDRFLVLKNGRTQEMTDNSQGTDLGRLFQEG